MEEKYEGDIEFVIADTNSSEGRSLAERFGVYYIPAFFILDGKGNILNSFGYQEVSDNPQKTMDSFISEAIKE